MPGFQRGKLLVVRRLKEPSDALHSFLMPFHQETEQVVVLICTLHGLIIQIRKVLSSGGRLVPCSGFDFSASP
jgi:hypothetical protein